MMRRAVFPVPPWRTFLHFRVFMMKIKRTKEIKEQVLLANKVKSELLRLIKNEISAAELKGIDVDAWNALLTEVELVAESFDLSLKACPLQDIDRRVSMLAGPFFTSSEHPVPKAGLGVMFPVLQLELKELSAAIKEDLGDGLIQIWYDLKAQQELIRVIPAADVKEQVMTEFEWIPVAIEDAFPIPHYWNLDPVGKGVQVISGLTSKGVQTTHDCFGACYFDASNDEKCWLWSLLQVFEKIAPEKFTHPIQMFGTHGVIQYSASDVKMNRLINLSDWGSTGHAQVFYKMKKGHPTEFSFWSCVR